MVKKMLAIVLTLVLVLCTIPLSAHAEELDPESDEMILMSAYTNTTKTTLSISTSGTATCTGSLTGYSGTTTKVEIFLYLQQYKNGAWSNVTGSWYSLFNTYKGTLQKTYGVAKGYQYRVKASYYAYSGSQFENIVKYSGTVTY